MTSSLTQNDHFGSNGGAGAGDLAPSSHTDSASLAPFAETVRILRRKRNQAFRRALLQRSKDYVATKKQATSGLYRKLDFHYDALHTQNKEISLVAKYDLSDKQQRDLYDGLGYTGLQRFLAEPDNAIFSLYAAESEAKALTIPPSTKLLKRLHNSPPGPRGG